MPRFNGRLETQLLDPNYTKNTFVIHKYWIQLIAVMTELQEVTAAGGGVTVRQQLAPATC